MGTTVTDTPESGSAEPVAAHAAQLAHSEHSEHEAHAADDDGFDGPAVVEVAGRSFAVRVRLAGYFQPLDGHYRWYGRIQRDDDLTALVGSGRVEAVLRTPHGVAQGSLGDTDLWSRYRIEGLGMPPFPVPVTVEQIENVAD